MTVLAGVDAAPASRDAAVLAAALCGGSPSGAGASPGGAAQAGAAGAGAGAAPGADAASPAPLLLAAVAIEPRASIGERLHRDAQAAAREQLDDAVALLRTECAPTAQAQFLNARSAPRALHELAAREPTAVVVLGSSRRAREGEAFAGRTARQVLNGAPCAIALAARGLHAPDEPQPFALRRIVVGVDGSPEAADALATARTLAHRCGAALHVVSVADESLPLRRAPLGEVVELAGWDEVVAQRRELAQRILDEALAVDRPTGELRVGDPPEQLAAAAACADLLVIGSRQRGALAHVVVGSTAEELLRGAPCSLLLVPRPPADA
ncbi:universal stress protein [Conexibacter sp. CPCC 206217]|uniref:universal stress protein n=1 Tax=Conexibacter sp. CPCC 206217 TaxID=3064574 RepID=UPI0027263943|nr:universal stress protein [Conexibacter sp. CPCC 206217]MDO8213200.1 universal stress protein [Conexibacter sp. CPCC 206217]